jgi:hypothetical protein
VALAPSLRVSDSEDRPSCCYLMLADSIPLAFPPNPTHRSTHCALKLDSDGDSDLVSTVEPARFLRELDH